MFLNFHWNFNMLMYINLIKQTRVTLSIIKLPSSPQNSTRMMIFKQLPIAKKSKHKNNGQYAPPCNQDPRLLEVRHQYFAKYSSYSN